MNEKNPFIKNSFSAPKMEDLIPLSCKSCGNSIFDQYYRMYKLSALNSPSGKPQVFNVPVFVCASCSEILDIKKIENNTEEIDNSVKSDNT